uniref:Uncharacterized protein n=1 Tax=Octopus bimaculoides TaxID=37653 RepID=A0A0L8GX02_OCTBM
MVLLYSIYQQLTVIFFMAPAPEEFPCSTQSERKKQICCCERMVVERIAGGIMEETGKTGRKRVMSGINIEDSRRQSGKVTGGLNKIQ